MNEDQVRLLESSFDAGKKLEPDRKFQLARELGVPPRQIAIWYQNKRARWKNQSLELDYTALQTELESALADKKELQQEVDDLRVELKHAQDILFGNFRTAATPPVTSLSSCCDEGGGSSSLNDDVGCSGNFANGHDQLELEELYACLMLGTAKGSSSCGQIPNAGLNNSGRNFWV
ncbi:hypothetical protein RD792_000287 [Penstemon davidsonii]|uniref:Homeobox-leucine zipper protein n=1 Tax=Penstemon davidsonii TaxID=160366 RepID=A0ABR0DUP8_9LAMI|nr:hypothetical protein RD792_000283 [Penstemon davidsonii]KAK4492960.1 hypothetical protein RD792_000287 [Penstemon davidsonii]